jgi:hypothetical protein
MNVAHVKRTAAGAVAVFVLCLGLTSGLPAREAGKDHRGLRVEEICRQIDLHRARIKDIEIHYDCLTGYMKKSENGGLEFVPAVVRRDKNGNLTVAKEGEFGHVDCIWREKGEKVFSEKHRIKYRRARGTKAEQVLKGLTRYAWNGEEGRGYRLEADEKYGQGDITAEPARRLRGGTGTPLTFTTRMWETAPEEEGGGPLTKIFREHDTEIVSANEEFQGSRCVVVRVAGHPGVRIDEKYWLDMNRGFNLVRYERLNSKGELLDVIPRIKLKEVGPNAWYPTEGIFYSPRSSAATKYRAHDVRVNQGLKNSEFAVGFPPGTYVTDVPKHRKYRATLQE